MGVVLTLGGRMRRIATIFLHWASVFVLVLCLIRLERRVAKIGETSQKVCWNETDICDGSTGVI